MNCNWRLLDETHSILGTPALLWPTMISFSAVVVVAVVVVAIGESGEMGSKCSEYHNSTIKCKSLLSNVSSIWNSRIYKTASRSLKGQTYLSSFNDDVKPEFGRAVQSDLFISVQNLKDLCRGRWIIDDPRRGHFAARGTIWKFTDNISTLCYSAVNMQSEMGTGEMVGVPQSEFWTDSTLMALLVG